MQKPAPETSANWPIRRMAHIVDRHSGNLSRELRPLGLTAPMWRVMNGLHEGGPSSIGDLAVHAALERSYVSRIVAKLSGLKLAEVRGDKTDRRFLHVALTSEGREVHKRAWELVVRINAQSIKGLGIEDLARLEDLMRRVAKNVGANFPE